MTFEQRSQCEGLKRKPSIQAEGTQGPETGLRNMLSECDPGEKLSWLESSDCRGKGPGARKLERWEVVRSHGCL